MRTGNARLIALDAPHAPPLARWLSDPETSKFSSLEVPVPHTISQAERMIEHFDVNVDSYFFGVANRREELVGFGGIGFIRWKDRSGMAGLLVGDEAHRDAGIGSSALRLILKFGFLELNLHRIFGEALAFNKRSIHMCEAAGFRVEGVKRQACFRSGQYHDTVLLGILADEFSP